MQSWGEFRADIVGRWMDENLEAELGGLSSVGNFGEFDGGSKRFQSVGAVGSERDGRAVFAGDAGFCGASAG